MQLSGKQIKALSALAVITLIAAYIWYSKTRPKPSDSFTIRAVNADDQATFQKMVTLFANTFDAGDLNWMLPDMAKHIDMVTGDYLAKGQITKSGAFLRTWAQERYGNRNAVERDVNVKMYNLFYGLKDRL